MRKLTKAERLACDGSLERDTSRLAHQPYDSCCDSASEDYKDSLDVTMSARGHSTREAQPRSRWLMFGDIALAPPVHERQRNKRKSAWPDFEELLKNLNSRRIEFLHVDLDLAMTLAQIAISADGDSAKREKRERNTRAARKAYDAIARFLGKVDTTARQRHQLARKLTHLHMLLVDLGEHFHSLPFAV